MAASTATPRVTDYLAVSPSGRTEVRVHVEEDGAFTIRATRDGHVIHDFSDNYEQPGVNGAPKHG